MSGFKGGRGGRRGDNANLKGSFLNGVWHCDCSPPLPAVHFPVKKAGPNKGRWFRTCQNKTCGFFLWDTDASPRELAALSNNSRSEPGRVHPVTPSRPRPQKPSPPPPYTSEARPSASSRKRSRPGVQDDDDEFDMGENAAFDEELDQVMTAIETPSKKARTDLLTTPATTPARRKLPWQKDGALKANVLHAPHTEQDHIRDVFKTPSVAPGSSFVTPSKSKQSDISSSQTITPGSSPVNTPTPSRFKDVGTSGADSELAQDVFGTLQEANVILTDQMRRNLTIVLSKHTIVAEGVKKGRDVARASVKAKDAKITELTYRVNTLEAELEAERAMVKHLQWKAESGHSSD